MRVNKSTSSYNIFIIFLGLKGAGQRPTIFKTMISLFHHVLVFSLQTIHMTGRIQKLTEIQTLPVKGKRVNIANNYCACEMDGMEEKVNI